jgi:hypothetical protein
MNTFCRIYLLLVSNPQPVKMLKTNFLIKPLRLLPVALFLLLILQSCTTYHYNYRSRGYIRTPPSTGHSRCGCLLPQKPDKTVDYAFIHVQ